MQRQSSSSENAKDLKRKAPEPSETPGLLTALTCTEDMPSTPLAPPKSKRTKTYGPKTSAEDPKDAKHCTIETVPDKQGPTVEEAFTIANVIGLRRANLDEYLPNLPKAPYGFCPLDMMDKNWSVVDLMDNPMGKTQRLYGDRVNVYLGQILTKDGMFQGKVHQGYLNGHRFGKTHNAAQDPRTFMGLLIRHTGVHWGLVSFNSNLFVDAYRACSGLADICFVAYVRGSSLTKYFSPATEILKVKEIVQTEELGDHLMVCTRFGLIPAVLMFYYDLVMHMFTDGYKNLKIGRKEVRQAIMHAREISLHLGTIWRGLTKLAWICDHCDADISWEAKSFEEFLEHMYDEAITADLVDHKGCTCEMHKNTDDVPMKGPKWPNRMHIPTENPAETEDEEA